MMRPRPAPHPRPRSGLILLEVIVSLAIFVAAAAMTLSITSSLLDSLHRTRTTHMAEDVALSMMAELEAGLLTLRDVQTGSTATVRGLVTFEDDLDDNDPVFELDVTARRSEHPGLSYVELTVTELPAAAGSTMMMSPTTGDAPPRPSATVRRLIPVTDEDFEAYEQDEMLEGIDTAPPAPPESPAAPAPSGSGNNPGGSESP